MNMPENSDSIGPGILAAVCNPATELKQTVGQMAKHTKYISKSDEEFFVNEKDSIYQWLFEQFSNKHPNLKISPELVQELRQGLRREVVKESQDCTLL
jgi:hypothetical protein